MTHPPISFSESARMPVKLSWKRFVQLDDSEAEMVLRWRNHEQVRRWMVRSHPISESEHRAFLERLHRTNDPDYYLLSLDGQAFGVADFYQIDLTESCCSYGYYLDPCRLGSSMGLLMEYWVAEFALMHWELHTLIAETRADNTAARELHAHMGFRTTGINARGLEASELDHSTWKQRRESILLQIERFFGER